MSIVGMEKKIAGCARIKEFPSSGLQNVFERKKLVSY
jgi:hypothetical protein